MASTSLAVVHDIPGRLRLRVPARVTPAQLAEAIEPLPGVLKSTWSDRTRGLLVEYDPQQLDGRAILEAVAAHADIDVDEAAAGHTNGHRPTLAAAVNDVVEAIDARVSKTTGGTARLGIVVSAGLALWAVSEIVRGRTAPLAWSSALWYAHGLFRDYQAREGR